MSMFNLGALAANVLNSLDNAAKDTLEEPRVSATALRNQRLNANNPDLETNPSDDEENDHPEPERPREPVVPRRLSAPKRSNSGNTMTVPLIVPKLPETYTTPSRAGHKIGGGYAFSYESNSNSSTVSNDGDNNGVDSAALESTAVGNDVGIAESSVEPAEEPDTTIVSEPSTPTAMSPKGEKTVTATTPTPAAEIKAPVTLPREPVETAETTADTATEGHAPTATASTPQSLIGSLVSSISNSAKKIPMGVAEGLTGAAAGSQGSHADMTASEAADKAGREAGRDKDKDKDKEILLLKKALKKKTQEIEKLNRECLDFEEQTAALKLEVQEAWANYKSSQERAAAVESELQDEIRQVQKAKLLDKQQSVAQLTKMGEEVAEAMRQAQAAQTQRAEVQARLDAAAEESAQWEERLQRVQQELAEAKMGTVQGVAALREELRQVQLNTEQMRADHSALLRQHQHRQADLERENAELVMSVTKQEKELQALRHHANANPGSLGPSMSSENRDYYTLQEEVSVLARNLEAEKDKSEELDRKLRITEREARAAQMNADEERKRSAASIDALSAKVAELEGRLLSRKLPTQGFSNGVGGFLVSSAASCEVGERMPGEGELGTDGAAAGQPSQSSVSLQDYEQAVRELQEHRAQSQNLSKLLLKKQGAVLELQAERSALKSRLIDMQARCSDVERQLASLRDLEDGGVGGLGGADFDAEGDAGEEQGLVASGRYSAAGLQRRAGGGAGGSQLLARPRDNKVISDLERFGVKPGAGVTHAVNMIDSWTILTGRFLRMYPLARMGFVLYLLVLHLWVLFILVLQTHSLELVADPRGQQIVNNLSA